MNHFEQLYKKHCQNLVRFAFYYVGDMEAAQDIVQEVFLKIWNQQPTFKTPDHEKSYLYKMTRNTCLMLLRKHEVRQRYQQQKSEVISDSPETTYIGKELDEAYKTTIFELPEKCRIIFCMSRFDDLSYKEIAKIQGISIKTVETQIGRALVFLRKKLSSFLSSSS
jgi:RNA polymerase sigma-70 factor, ECF subfamily